MSSSASLQPPASSSTSSSSAPLPTTTLSPMGKLLYVSTKLYARHLISLDEKRILKRLSIRNDPAVAELEFDSPNFLTQLIDTTASIAITEASHTFHNILYRHCTTNHGKTLSKSERKSKEIHDNSFVYGEIDFHSFAQIIKEIRPLFAHDGCFVDLGSGTGRPVFAMALLSEMKKIIGIEALDSLHQAASEILEEYETFVEDDTVVVEAEDGDENENDNSDDDIADVDPSLPSSVDPSNSTSLSLSPTRPAKKKKVIHSPFTKLEQRTKSTVPSNDRRIELIHGDFLQIDWWSKGDFVFLNSTCYSPTLMKSITQLAERLRSGAIVVSLTKSLQSNEFTVLSKQKYQMSWGSATAYVQKRK